VVEADSPHERCFRPDLPVSGRSLLERAKATDSKSKEDDLMIAAIYARKSTEQKGIGDEEKFGHSTGPACEGVRQEEGLVRGRGALYVDDGVSGAEFVKRPGLARLMLSLKPSPSFRILVMSEESRLGREQIETAYILKQITTDAGVRVFFYLTDQERTLESALDNVMLSLTNFASEMEREKARQRAHDAMLRKANALHVASGKVYGYDKMSRSFHLRQGPMGDRSASTWYAGPTPSRRRLNSGGKSWQPPIMPDGRHRV
jgi:DNA invertase Pin-like site-specific DNA recombinase